MYGVEWLTIKETEIKKIKALDSQRCGCGITIYGISWKYRMSTEEVLLWINKTIEIEISSKQEN